MEEGGWRNEEGIRVDGARLVTGCSFNTGHFHVFVYDSFFSNVIPFLFWNISFSSKQTHTLVFQTLTINNFRCSLLFITGQIAK